MTDSVRKRLGVATAIMTGSVLFSRILGYIRDAVIAAKHGASADTDVYFAAFTIPDLMGYMLAGGALSITFLPIFSSYIHSDREQEGWDCFSVVATTVGAILIVLTVVAYFLVPWLVPRFLPGFTHDQVADTVRLTRIVLPAQIFFYVGGLLGATVMSRERFLEAALAPIVYNLCIIAGGVFLGTGIEGFSWGALIGAALGPFGLMLWAARRRGLRFRLHFSLNDPNLKRFLRLSIPVMLGFSLVTVDEWITRYFASGMDTGAISWIQNARRLMLVPVAVLGQAAGQATLPFMARLHTEEKTREAGAVLSDALRLVMFATLAASVWMAVTSQPIVSLFYERGLFDAHDTMHCASALVFLAIGISAWAMQALVARGFYAMQDTWSPMIIASVVTLLAVPVYWQLGSGPMKHNGLALATTLGVTVTALVTLLMLHRKLPLPLGQLAGSIGRSAVIAAASGAASWGVLHALADRADWVRVLSSFGIFVACVALLSTALKAPEFRTLYRWALRRSQSN